MYIYIHIYIYTYLQVNYMDDAVDQIVTALKAKSMWDSTLMLFTSDST